MQHQRAFQIIYTRKIVQTGVNKDIFRSMVTIQLQGKIIKYMHTFNNKNIGTNKYKNTLLA